MEELCAASTKRPHEMYYGPRINMAPAAHVYVTEWHAYFLNLGKPGKKSYVADLTAC